MTVHSSKLIVAEIPAAHSGERNFSFYTQGFKRVLDLVIVIAALPFLIPAFIVIGTFVALDGHSPFFRQERVGLSGKRFFIWKFRTMVPDAEELLNEYLASNPAAQSEWDEKQKLTSDPRITRIGRVLRRTSFDELPQIFNILTGEMSLVGPRPMMPSQQALYPGHAYYRLRPGVTGSWQVSERHTSSFAERATYDDGYEANLSLFTDVKILTQTVGVVFRCTGV